VVGVINEDRELGAGRVGRASLERCHTDELAVLFCHHRAVINRRRPDQSRDLRVDDVVARRTEEAQAQVVVRATPVQGRQPGRVIRCDWAQLDDVSVRGQSVRHDRSG
jgi:hypothetical protein